MTNEVQVAPPKQVDLPVVLGLEPSLPKEAQAALDAAGKIQKIVSRLSLGPAIAAAGRMKGIAKSIETARRAKLKPIEDAIKALNKLCKEITDPLRAEIDRLERAAGAFQADQDRKARIAAEAAEAAAERDRSEQTQVISRDSIDQTLSAATLVAPPVVAPAVIPKAVKGASTERFWDWELVDAWELAKHSKDAVDIKVKASVVNAWVKAGSREIPGIRIFENTTVVAKAT